MSYARFQALQRVAAAHPTGGKLSTSSARGPCSYHRASLHKIGKIAMAQAMTRACARLSSASDVNASHRSTAGRRWVATAGDRGCTDGTISGRASGCRERHLYGAFSKHLWQPCYDPPHEGRGPRCYPPSFLQRAAPRSLRRGVTAISSRIFCRPSERGARPGPDEKGARRGTGALAHVCAGRGNPALRRRPRSFERGCGHSAETIYRQPSSRCGCAKSPQLLKCYVNWGEGGWKVAGLTDWKGLNRSRRRESPGALMVHR